MREVDPLITEYSHEKHRKREAEALLTLRKVASLVKPIMRARNWRVGTLSEFYPDQQNLLGLNVNQGQKVLLRLRYPGDANQFLPLEQVVDTMLHELSHNVFGPHDAKFHALWDQLRDEYAGLKRKGYTGEGFLSQGKQLGGKRVPRDEARRIARNAAEKRRTLNAGSGQKLGGAPLPVGTDIRNVIVDAIERRSTITKGCGSGDTKTATEIKAISDQAASNGFRTKAEEDKANDAAIAQALWELAQEDEKEKYGGSYVSPSAANPTGMNGSAETSRVPGPARAPSAPVPEVRAPPLPANKPTPRSITSNQPPTRPGTNRPLSRLVSESNKKTTSTPVSSSTSSPHIETVWECPICTLHNPLNFLLCDACGTEKPAAAIQKAAQSSASRPNVATTTRSVKPKTWTCHMCSTIMEDQWWTCSTCAAMKQSS